VKKREREKLAERLNESARQNTNAARGHRAAAEDVRDQERRSVYKDPVATRAIARHHEANARTMRAMAREVTKPWWRR
jgi:hypothetical protein